MAAGQKIHITITGTQYPPQAGEADEPVITIQEAEAEYFQKGDSNYLFYEEQPEGFPVPLKTRIKRKGETLEIHRQGPGGSTMFFVPGKTYRTEYYTPYGMLLLDIVTDKLTIGSGAENAWAETVVEYGLYNEGELLGNYRIVIEQKL